MQEMMICLTLRVILKKVSKKLIGASINVFYTKEAQGTGKTLMATFIAEPIILQPEKKKFHGFLFNKKFTGKPFKKNL
jgi:hypothetical protein